MLSIYKIEQEKTKERNEMEKKNKHIKRLAKVEVKMFRLSTL